MAARVRELVGAVEPDPASENQDRAWVPGMRPPTRSDGEQPSGWRGRLRWDPGRRGVAALGLAVVVVLAATGWWLAAAKPTPMPVDTAAGGAPATAAVSAATPAPVSAVVSDPVSSPLPGTTSPAVASPPSSSTSGGTVVVDVAGRVRRPGVYTLPAGARIYEALRAAGGARPGAGTVALNLAAPLQDGEQIVVGTPHAGVTGAPVAGEVVPGSSDAIDGSTAAAAPVELNTATLEQLESLPGIGPVLAQDILDWRAQHGQFASIDQLQDVSGIGPAKFAEVKDLVSV